MKKETYDTLSEKERLLYDELYAFSLRLTERMEELIRVLREAVGEANEKDEN